MKAPLFITSACMSLALTIGCTSNNAASPVGEWKWDTATIPSDMPDKAREALSGERIIFNKDHSFRFAKMAWHGTWTTEGVVVTMKPNEHSTSWQAIMTSSKDLQTGITPLAVTLKVGPPESLEWKLDIPGAKTNVLVRSD